MIQPQEVKHLPNTCPLCHKRLAKSVSAYDCLSKVGANRYQATCCGIHYEYADGHYCLINQVSDPNQMAMFYCKEKA